MRVLRGRCIDASARPAWNTRDADDGPVDGAGGREFLAGNMREAPHPAMLMKPRFGNGLDLAEVRLALSAAGPPPIAVTQGDGSHADRDGIGVLEDEAGDARRTDPAGVTAARSQFALALKPDDVETQLVEQCTVEPALADAPSRADAEQIVGLRHYEDVPGHRGLPCTPRGTSIAPGCAREQDYRVTLEMLKTTIKQGAICQAEFAKVSYAVLR